MLNVVLTSSWKKALQAAGENIAGQRWALVDRELGDHDAFVRKGITIVALETVLAQNEALLEKEYINNVAELSYLDSVAWWANSLSEKNEHLSTFYRRLCFYFGATQILLKFKDQQGLFFVVADNDIIQSLSVFCRENNFRVRLLDSYWLAQVNALRVRAWEILKILRYLGRTLVRKIFLGGIVDSQRLTDKEVYAVRTWLDRRFLERDLLRQDAYFGRLPAFLKDKGQNVIFIVGILDKFCEVIRDIKQNKQTLIIPEEYFLNLRDFLFVIGCLLNGRLQIKNKIFFGGVETTDFYREELCRGRLNESFVRNVLSYQIARRFTKQLKLKTYIQTFENFAWEKLTVRGIKSVNTQIPILGFQHAFISRNSFKYFPGVAEKNSIPLPTKIITMGKRTKAILERYGCYNGQTQLIEGCALRQEYIGKEGVLARKIHRQVLIPLTMVKEEVSLTLDFLAQARLGQAKIKVLIRPHPATSFEQFITEKYLARYDYMTVSREGLQRELQNVDTVLYTWSTVAVEALKLGLPIVYLDILRPMYVDPLFECDSLKRRVSDPAKLVPVIESIYAMNESDFFREQTAAQNYLQDYFGPVDEHSLATFLVN